jgi:hypothetical protein
MGCGYRLWCDYLLNRVFSKHHVSDVLNDLCLKYDGNTINLTSKRCDINGKRSSGRAKDQITRNRGFSLYTIDLVFIINGSLKAKLAEDVSSSLFATVAFVSIIKY